MRHHGGSIFWKTREIGLPSQALTVKYVLCARTFPNKNSSGRMTGQENNLARRGENWKLENLSEKLVSVNIQ
jgi:hypothetical protein